MKYELIPTLGPASRAPETWSAMLDAGATGFRLNTSHLSPAGLDEWLEKLEPFRAGLEAELPLVLDLQGSKWRLGGFLPFQAVAGDRLRLVLASKADQPGVLPVPHEDFFEAAHLSSGEIRLNDAKVRLEVESVAAGEVRARVVLGGELSPRKGITFAHSSYRQESLNERDRAILAATRGLPGLRYAISYVKDAAEMSAYRDWFSPAYLIAKLERGQALEQAQEIAAHASELWVCRGDLGAELGMKGMAEAVHAVSSRLETISVPVLLAGQVLEHMSASPSPTRSEVCCLYEALACGYRGFVLSDETAAGSYPVESVRAGAIFQPGPGTNGSR